MAAKLGVIIVHGMGSQTTTFANDLSKDLEIRLAKKGIPPGVVSYCPLFWADVLTQSEKDLLDKENASGKLAWQEVRGFVVHNLADAIAYRRADDEAGAVYDQVH